MIESIGSASARLGYCLFGSPSDPPKRCGDVAQLLRRDHPKGHPMIRLLEVLDQNEVLTFEQLREHVHRSDVEDKAVERLVERARSLIDHYGLGCTLTISGSTLIRSYLPVN